MKTAGIVLAAGSASRMGRNKVLLRFGGESLLRRAVRTADEAELDPIVVVLGHEAERARQELHGVRCAPILNPRHAAGMSTSLAAGVAALPANAAAAVVLLADMPFVTAPMVRALVARHLEGGAPVVASRYGAAQAPPTLFARRLFGELGRGEGDEGAREVVRRHRGEVAWVTWPEDALADLDDADDLERARARLEEERR
jgi:molybdenum cofactor cytidylyltransferase